MTFSPVAVIPVYNHPHRLAAVVAGLRAHGLPVILVDDGSNPETAAVIDNESRGADVHCVRLAVNQGKGAAVTAGLEAARDQGFTHAVQVDADGQHDLEALPRLLEESRGYPAALVSGQPVYDASVPRSRLYGRYLTHVLVWIQTLSFDVRDSMCGFRVYPLAETLAVTASERIGKRMDFDTGIMVRLHWRGVAVRFVPVRVTYPENGVSHFDVLRDNARITRMHTRLLFGMLWRLPGLLARKLRRRRTAPGAWAELGERGSLFGMRLMAYASRLLGQRFARVLLHPVALYFVLANGKARRASRAYLARVNLRVDPQWRARTRPVFANVHRHFHAFAEVVFEKFAAWHQPDHRPAARLHGAGILDSIRGGRGMLFFSAHLGSLEMCRALALDESGVRVNALVYTRNARKFSEFMREVNPAFHERLILVDHIGADTAVQLRTLLDRGEVVVMVADRTPASGNGRIVHADFLGERAAFATGPYILAHLLECPVGLMFCLRDDDGGYNIVMERFAEQIRLPRHAREEEMTAYAARFAQRLEHHARQHPLQWFNFYDFWAEDGGAHARPAASAVEMKANG